MIGWLGNLLSIIGVATVAPSRPWSLLISAVGCSCWVWEGYCLSRLDLLSMNVVIAVLLFVNYLRWNTPSTAETSTTSYRR